MDSIYPLIGPVLTAIITAGGVYAAITNRITRLETKIDVLTEQVEKHNMLIERMYKVEQDVTNLYHRYDELRDGINHIKEG